MPDTTTILKSSAYKSEFEKIALPYIHFIFKLAFRMAGNPANAEDLTQETYRIAYEKFYQLKEKDKCKSWLAIILKNLFFKELKKKKRMPSVDLELLSPYLADPKNFDTEALKGLVSEELQGLLDQLDEKYKVPLVLFYLGEFSYKEIATMLVIPLGTVMSRISRGKQYLRKYYDQKEHAIKKV